MPPRSRSRRGAGARPARGFTLVEVLVALLVMSLIAAMAWQGVDGMVRTRDASQRRLEATLRLGTVLAQWQQDLASLQESGGSVPALRCDGATLQLTRRAPGGLQLVVWSLRGGRLLRWAAPAVVSSLELQDRWVRAQQLLGEEPSQVRMLEGVSQWQLYFFRRNAWANCQSSGDLLVSETAAAPAAASAPAAAASGPPPRRHRARRRRRRWHARARSCRPACGWCSRSPPAAATPAA